MNQMKRYNLRERPSKKLKQEPKGSEVRKLDDLPVLPFEKIINYLPLEDRIRSRAVSRRWRQTIDGFKSKSLCFSTHPSDRLIRKAHWLSGKYAQNFINSTKFSEFFDTFGPSILPSLKHLRLCDFELENAAAFLRILNSFSQLEDLEIIKFSDPRANYNANLYIHLDLNLPMLQSFKLEETTQISWLTLNAPRLKAIKLRECSFFAKWLRPVKIVHLNSVEKLVVDHRLKKLNVEEFKKLKYLYIDEEFGISSTLLRSLKQLKEIHVRDPYYTITSLYEQKRQYGRTDLKIYLCGLLLNGLDDPAIDSLSYHNNGSTFIYLAENASISRLADEMPFFDYLFYEAIEAVAPGSEIDLNRFSDLNRITVQKPVQDIERFLNFLKNSGNIPGLWLQNDQPQKLFDRLPENLAIQQLNMGSASDFAFLTRLKHLVCLTIRCSIDTESIQKVLEELKFLELFEFNYFNIQVDITIDHRKKQFNVKIHYGEDTTVLSVTSAIQFIIDANQQKEELMQEKIPKQMKKDEQKRKKKPKRRKMKK